MNFSLSRQEPRADVEKVRTPRQRVPWFWWLIVNTLAISLAAASWIICLKVFKDPTHPSSYQLMRKVGRIPPLEPFVGSTAPSAEWTDDARSLEARFRGLDEPTREALNQSFLKNYLLNLPKSSLLTYVVGDFRILEKRALTEDDFFPSGAAVKAQALVQPDGMTETVPYPVFIELLVPGSKGILATYEEGSVLSLSRSTHHAALLHLSETAYRDRKAPLFTVIPLTNNNPEAKPPESANPQAQLPAFR